MEALSSFLTSPRDPQHMGMHQLTSEQEDRVGLTTYKGFTAMQYSTEYLYCFDFSVTISNLMSALDFII